jgi:hypothetical protein
VITSQVQVLTSVSEIVHLETCKQEPGEGEKFILCRTQRYPVAFGMAT